MFLLLFYLQGVTVLSVGIVRFKGVEDWTLIESNIASVLPLST